MEIIIKTEKKPFEELKGNFLEKRKGKLYYSIQANDLLKVLSYLKENGINKVKIEINNSDKFLKQENINNSRKISRVEYLERLLKNEIKILDENQNIREFFDLIGLYDENNEIYHAFVLVKVDTENGILFSQALKKVKINSDIFNKWLREKDPNYVLTFSNGIPYSNLIKLLLNHIK